MDEFSGYYDQIAAMNAANNAWSAEQAQKQMDFQERLSSTAHQREVADLQAAGLNPILSARSAGATTPSGAMGSTDTSGPGAMVSLLGHLVQSMTAMENARLSAQASLAVAEKYNATSELIARLQTGNQMDMLLRQFEFNRENPNTLWSALSSVLSGAFTGAGVPGISGLNSASRWTNSKTRSIFGSGLLSQPSSSLGSDLFKLLQDFFSRSSSAKSSGPSGHSSSSSGRWLW